MEKRNKKKKYFIILLTIVVISILILTLVKIFSPNERVMSLEEFRKKCATNLCDGETFYLEGWISYHLLNVSLSRYEENYWSGITVDVREIARFTLENGFRSIPEEHIYLDEELYLMNGVVVDENKAFYLTDGMVDENKLASVIEELLKKMGKDTSKPRKVKVKVTLEKSGTQYFLHLKNVSDFEVLENEDVILPRQELLEKIDECNNFIEEYNRTDLCFGYYYLDSWRSCNYVGKEKTCPGFGGSWKEEIDFYELTNDDLREMCLRYEHKGISADCLRRVSKEECLEFAKGDLYLIAVCNYEYPNYIDGEGFKPRTIKDFS